MSFWDDLIRAGARAKSGAKEIDLGDIKSPKLKPGPAPKSKAIPVNELDLPKIKDELELGDIQSQEIPVSEFDFGDITDPALKKGRPAAPMSIEPNPRDLTVSRKKIPEIESSSMSTPINEFDMGDIPGNLSIDDPKLPVLSQGLDVVGGNKVPALRSGFDAAESARTPALRTQTMPEEVGVKVLGKAGQSKYFKQDHIIDADFIDSVNNKQAKTILEKNKGKKISDLLKSPTAKKLLIGAGIVIGAKTGYDAFVNQSIETSPSAKFTPPNIIGSKEVLAEEARVAQKDRELEKGQQTKKIENVSDLVNSFQDKKDDEEAKSNRLDYMNLMMNAQQAANQNNFANAILKAGIQAGNAISRSGKEADYTVADELAKTANAPVENVKKIAETDVTQMKLDEMKRDEKEAADLKDPNSEISKFYREKFGAFIPGISERTPAFAIMKAAPNLIQLINTKEAAKSREFIARQHADYQKEKQEEKAEERLRERQKLNPRQGDVLTALDNAESELQNIVDMLGDNSGWVGPLDELVPDSWLFDDKQSAFRTATGKIEDVYRHAITGAGAGPRELTTLKTRVPNIGDRPGQFKAKAQEAIDDIRRKRKIQLDNLKKQGKNVSEYQPIVENSNLTTPGTAGMVKVTRKSDGQSAFMTSEEIAEMTDAEKEKYKIGE